MKLVLALPIAAIAMAVLAGCTQGTPAASQATTTANSPNTVWVPVTDPTTPRTTTAPPTTTAAPKPPVAPASYSSFDWSWPAPPAAAQAGADGKALRVPVPAGWAKSPDGDKTDYRDPTGQLLVQLQRVTFPITTAQGPSTPVGYDVNKMLQREQATKAEYPDYHLISLGQTDLGQVDPVPGAEWVFTFVSNGTTRVVTVLGIHYEPNDFITVYVSGPLQYSSVTATVANAEHDFQFIG
jgi:hypothetical protein